MQPLLVTVDGATPDVAAATFIAPNATAIGKVTLARGTSLFYGCVLRADGGTISIGEDSNVQDLTVMHADPGYPIVIGARVTVGHRVIIHGARIDDDVLVGMGAVIMNGAHVGSGSVIGAGALITEHTQIPAGSLVLGVPARVARPAGEAEAAMIAHGAARYRELSALHASAGFGASG